MRISLPIDDEPINHCYVTEVIDIYCFVVTCASNPNSDAGGMWHIAQARVKMLSFKLGGGVHQS